MLDLRVMSGLLDAFCLNCLPGNFFSSTQTGFASFSGLQQIQCLSLMAKNKGKIARLHCQVFLPKRALCCRMLTSVGHSVVCGLLEFILVREHLWRPNLASLRQKVDSFISGGEFPRYIAPVSLHSLPPRAVQKVHITLPSLTNPVDDCDPRCRGVQP